jgi:hypothetical protein
MRSIVLPASRSGNRPDHESVRRTLEAKNGGEFIVVTVTLEALR